MTTITINNEIFSGLVEGEISRFNFITERGEEKVSKLETTLKSIKEESQTPAMIAVVAIIEKDLREAREEYASELNEFVDDIRNRLAETAKWDAIRARQAADFERMGVKKGDLVRINGGPTEHVTWAGRTKQGKDSIRVSSLHGSTVEWFDVSDITFEVVGDIWDYKREERNRKARERYAAKKARKARR